LAVGLKRNSHPSWVFEFFQAEGRIVCLCCLVSFLLFLFLVIFLSFRTYCACVWVSSLTDRLVFYLLNFELLTLEEMPIQIDFMSKIMICMIPTIWANLTAIFLPNFIHDKSQEILYFCLLKTPRNKYLMLNSHISHLKFSHFH